MYECIFFIGFVIMFFVFNVFILIDLLVIKFFVGNIVFIKLYLYVIEVFNI